MAPVWRIASTKSRTEQDPSVFWDPNLVSPIACSTRTVFQSTSELLGDHQRQRGTASGAHFGAVRRDHNLTVGFKAEVDAGLPCGGRRGRIGKEIRAQYESAGGENGAEEGPPIDGEQFDSYLRPAVFPYASRVRRAISETVLGAASMAAAVGRVISRFAFSGAGKLVP